MPKIIQSDDKEAIQTAIKVLNDGGLIAFPTETSYGLGADPTNEEAINKVYTLKQMSKDKKMSAMVASKEEVHKWFYKDEKVDALIDAFLPGPLTIIKNTQSFRIPDHPFCLKLCQAFKKPITSTSANVTGKGDPYSAEEVLAQIPDIDLIIDGGLLKRNKPSTVFDVDKNQVIRPGPINEEDIQDVLS